MDMPNADFGGWQTESEKEHMAVDHLPEGGARDVYNHRCLSSQNQPP